MLTKIILMFLCFFQFNFVCAEDDSYWDDHLVRSYVHNSELQRRWMWAFLAPHMKELKGDERILDVGCGDGKITADLSRFVPKGSVIGIDPSEAMLEWATRQYGALEYPNLSFKTGGFLETDLLGPFDVIISNCALQHCKDQLLALQNLYRLLKPNGKLWISVPAMNNVAWKNAWKHVAALPKWSSYWENDRPRQFSSVEKYKEMLTEAKFQVHCVENIKTQDPFVDREEFLTFLLGTMNPNVPLSLSREFFSELIDEYVRLLPDALRTDGAIEVRFGRLIIEASRPN